MAMNSEMLRIFGETEKLSCEDKYTLGNIKILSNCWMELIKVSLSYTRVHNLYRLSKKVQVY